MTREEMILAAKKSLEVAERAGDLDDSKKPECGLDHLRSMIAVMESTEMSPDKLGRWLGWIQACVVVMCPEDVDLALMKDLNANSGVTSG